MHSTRNENFTSGSAEQATAPRHLGGAALRAWPDSKLWNGFLGRHGGVSRGPYESLNLSWFCADDPAAVRENWRRLRACFPPHTRFAQVNQVHGNAIHVVEAHEADAPIDGRPSADGMVTAVRGVVLGVLSADCIPLLMADREAGVVGALHAGWRGVIADIAANGVRAMCALGARPERIEAALGPAIGGCCFEVDIDLARRFESEVSGAGAHIRVAGRRKAFVDLKKIVSDQLVAAGLEGLAITSAGICTRCSNERFFSRRAAGGAITGLQLSFVGMPV